MLLKKHNGFYLAELLLSLSGWMLIAGILVPLFIQLNKQSIQLQEKSAALHILYEYMQSTVVEKGERENGIVTREHRQYEVIWEDESASGKREVKVRYEDVFGNIVQLYETIQ